MNLAVFVCFSLSMVAAPAKLIAQQDTTDHAGGFVHAASESQLVGWIELYDQKSLTGWEITNFGGEGDVLQKPFENSSVIHLDAGHPFTGITFVGTEQTPPTKLPTIEYEIEVQVRRKSGSDFFCGLTFPYKSSHCTLILGGWGGQLVGLSSLDDKDASENETTDYLSFKNDHWYKVQVIVTDGRIETKLDGKQIVICNIGDRKVNTRADINLSRPLGIASYQTVSQIRSIRVRKLAQTPTSK